MDQRSGAYTRIGHHWSKIWAGGGGCRGGFRGSSLGFLEPPFLKLAIYYHQTLTELALEIRSAVQSCQI